MIRRFCWLGLLLVLSNLVSLGVGRAIETAMAAPPAPGIVWAWGSDGAGALGDGTVESPASNATPGQVVGPASGTFLNDVVAVAGGRDYSLALRSDGTVWAWGYDGYGQFGDGTVGTPDLSATPSQVVAPGGGFLTNVIAIAAGYNHVLALKGDGTVWAWGDDSSGQLGDGTVAAPNVRATPSQVVALTNVIAIAGGQFHSLALKGDGTVWAWGDDTFGQLGDGTVGSPANRATPGQAVAPGGVLTDVIAVAGGISHGLALKSDGTVWAWGDDTYGQLGDGAVGTPASRATPSKVVSLTNVIAIAGGAYHSLALRSDGAVWAWGADTNGQLGDGTVASPASSATPSRVVAPGGGFLTNVTAIASRNDYNLVLRLPTARVLTTGTTGSGSGTVSTVQNGQVVSVSAVPEAGSLFTSWVVDGTPVGWAVPLTITMDEDHTVQANFVTTKRFTSDVPTNHPDFTAITELATRGYILGYNANSYGPDDGVQRAQMAVLIARATPNGPGTPTNGTLTPPGCTVAGTWDCEDWGTTFTDRGGVPASLWRAAGTLQHYGVAFGYSAADCAKNGRAFPCYGPTDPVSYAQTIAFISRAMIAKGYWVAQPNAPLPGGNVPGVLATPIRTFAFYTGGIPDAPADWNAEASRGWFAEALWAALNSYWGTDGTLPDGRPGGGAVP